MLKKFQKWWIIYSLDLKPQLELVKEVVGGEMMMVSSEKCMIPIKVNFSAKFDQI